jgi:hypothetical protein
MSKQLIKPIDIEKIKQVKNEFYWDWIKRVALEINRVVGEINTQLERSNT